MCEKCDATIATNRAVEAVLLRSDHAPMRLFGKMFSQVLLLSDRVKAGELDTDAAWKLLESEADALVTHSTDAATVRELPHAIGQLENVIDLINACLRQRREEHAAGVKLALDDLFAVILGSTRPTPNLN